VRFLAIAYSVLICHLVESCSFIPLRGSGYWMATFVIDYYKGVLTVSSFDILHPHTHAFAYLHAPIILSAEDRFEQWMQQAQVVW
jgi:hypothetical protein